MSKTQQLSQRSGNQLAATFSKASVPANQNPLAEKYRREHPEWSDDQVQAAVEVAAEVGAISNVPARPAMRSAGTQSLASRFSKAKATAQPRAKFDPVAYYGLKNVVQIGQREDGDGNTVPISIGIVFHPKGTMKEGRFNKQYDASRYNGNLVVVGLKGTADPVTPETMALQVDLAPAIASFLRSNESAILQAMQSAVEDAPAPAQQEQLQTQ